MGILDGIIDDATNTIGDFVDTTSSVRSLTPGFDINTPDSGYFTGVDDALANLGGEFRSPAFASVERMKDASTSLNITENLDLYTLQQGFGTENADQMWGTLQEVQGLSDALDECGNYAQDALSAATTDYIKNTGIQEAGRELADKLAGIGGGGLTDCIVGFATLFDSAGIIDDALGLGDLSQIQSRIADVIRMATDASNLSNMLLNLDVVSGLLDDFNDMCTGMKDAFNKLIASDLASLMSILNKLAQWAAFAKIANSDPCALVNNNKMLSHITAPVMDDIVKLYNSVTGSDAHQANPIIPLGEILGTKPKFPDLPRYTQAAGEGLIGFQAFKSNIPGEFITVTDSIVKEQLIFVDGEWVSGVTTTTVPMDFVDGEWVSNQHMEDKSSFTQNITKGVSSIDDSTLSFVKAKDSVAFASIINSGDNIQSLDGIVEGFIEGVEDVVEDFTEYATRTAAAVLTLLVPDTGSGEDKVSGILGETKLRSINQALVALPKFSPPKFSTEDGPKRSQTDTTKPPISAKSKQDYAFNRSGVVPGKTVCTCHNPTFSGASLEKEVTTVKAVIRTIEQNLSSGLSLEENKEDWNSLLVERNAYLTSIEGKDPMTNSSVCSALNGVWKCAVDVREVSKPSSDQLSQIKNVELANALPTSKPFDTSKIGV